MGQGDLGSGLTIFYFNETKEHDMKVMKVLNVYIFDIFSRKVQEHLTRHNTSSTTLIYNIIDNSRQFSKVMLSNHV